MTERIQCSSCGGWINFDTENCYQLRLGHLESTDADFHAHEDAGYYHMGCI